jgi:hypothetical protein
MFNKRRVADLLSPLGFFLAFESHTEAGFVRANGRVGLFEEIDLCAGRRRGGRWGDIACAGVSIALTPGEFTSPKGMAEVECLSDWAATKTKEQAVAWERSVIAAPITLDALIRRRREELLARTAIARVAAVHYLGLLDNRLTVPEMIAKLTEGATDEELQEARRLARTEGFISLPERACYDLIVLLITRYAGEVESDRACFWGKSPNAVPELNWRFQLLASRLFPERGWELLDAGGVAEPGFST